jgi:hypothetical protein
MTAQTEIQIGTLSRLTVVSLWDHESLNLPQLSDFADGLIAALFTGYEFGALYEGTWTSHPPPFDIGDLNIRRISYNSPLTILLEFAPYGGPFLAAHGLIFLWREISKARVLDAAASYEVDRYRRAMVADGKEPNLDVEAVVAVAEFLRDHVQSLELSGPEDAGGTTRTVQGSTGTFSSHEESDRRQTLDESDYSPVEVPDDDPDDDSTD